MPLINVSAAPFRLDRPSFVIDHAGVDPIQIQCQGRNLIWQADQQFEDIESFCNPLGEAPGAVSQSINLEINQSFGDPAGALPGLWNTLKPLEGTLVTFALLLAGPTAVSPENPEASGQFYVPTIPFIDAGVRKYSQFTLEFRIFGDVAYATTAVGAAYNAHT